MPFYTDITKMRHPEEDPERTAERLLQVKDGLEKSGVPAKSLDRTLLLATWNIREFDSEKYGYRTRESYLYIAEIVSAFDIVAIQEVREDLHALDRLMGHLGYWWDYVLTDVTEGRPGNRERMAFVYDGRKVKFGGLAGEIVLPAKKSSAGAAEPVRQFARTPFIVGYRVDWLQFTICTAHIFYGTKKALDPQRLAEIDSLARFLKARTAEKFAWAPNMIMLGDFNIFATTDDTLKAIVRQGFQVSAKLQELPSNATGGKHYDQIAILGKDLPEVDSLPAGVFDYYQYLYRDEDEPLYAPAMGQAYADKPDAKKRSRYYREWRTYQMSDHLPMWIELPTDFSRKYLESKVEHREEAHLAAQVAMPNLA